MPVRISPIRERQPGGAPAVWIQAGARRWLSAVLAVTLTATGVQALTAVPASAAAAGKGTAPAPVSNAFALGGGVGGSIDQRTGAFQASVPLVNIAGRAGTGLSIALSYDQSMAALGAAGDRFGLGAGWSLGVPWVDTAGGVQVYPASGGSYAYDASSPTGLHQYPLRDLVFAKDPGKIPARSGLQAAQPYLYTLTYLDGTIDRFDANGNLVERVDRFGNAIDLTWRQSGNVWRPTSVVDNYGQLTQFDYSTPGQVKVISPVNAEGITAATTLSISQGRLASLTDPLGQQTTFEYSPVAGLPAQVQLLSSVTSPTGEHTSISYSQLSYETNVVTVSTVTVKNAAGVQVLATRHFNINPPGDSGEHNYTGYPAYNAKAASCGCDALFNSGDFNYRYTTSLSDGTSTVESTYNSLHLLVSQKVTVVSPTQGTVVNQVQAYSYPPVTSVADLPANYAKPVSATVDYGDRSYGTVRTVVTKSSYNDKGELVSATNAAGTVTTSTYYPNGLPDTQTVTGTDGDTSITTNTLTADGKSVHTVTTAVGATAATATARTVATYDHNGSGQVTGEVLAWAPEAQPPGPGGGPDQIDDTQQISVDTAAHTQTDVFTTAAGTPHAGSTTTVTDLVTGEVLSKTNPDNLTTTYTYDALGRDLTRTAPGGLTTKTLYNSPTMTTVTAPSGLETQTTTDVLGRTLKVTDNVSGEQLVTDLAARTVENDSYSVDGSKLTAATPAGATTTTFDPLGRPVRIVQPDGITQTDQYNDVKNTQTVSLLGIGATDPTSVTTDGFSDLNQPISSATSYPDGTPQAPASETYDGLGRVASFTANNVTAKVSYPGAGGLQAATSLTPGDTATFPGDPVTSKTDNTMTGAMTAKTLTGQAATTRVAKAAAGSATGTTYTYNDAGQVATATDPGGHTTRYTYTPAGQVASITAPSGVVTTYTFDPATGRLARKDVRAPDGTTQDIGYTYYPSTGLVKSVYHPDHPDDAITYDYDADGHLTAIHYPDGTSTAATYRDNGQLATTADITGAVTTYTYNADGTCGAAAADLCRAVQERSGTTLDSVAYTYDNLDRVHTITRGNGVTTTVTYTDTSQVKTETTTAADGTPIRTDGYTYDAHGNIATHTITIPATHARPGQAARPTQTAATTVTAYGYDAYNRLISSATYPGAAATGTPTTATSYTLGVAGDVTGQTTTADGKTTTTVNTIDGGQLTARDVNGTITHQDFNADGNVTKDLAGNSYTYNLTGQIATITTLAGVTTSYSYWPDGTRRAATTSVNGVDHTVTYHYTTSRQLSNDTYTGGGPTVTASYLMAVNREARTLATGTSHAAAQVSGPGTGYYLSDAHGSVVALTGDQGQLTSTYGYSDYGQPTGPGTGLLPTPAADPAGNAEVNPFTYDGAYTNPATGTQYLPARTYDPAQGRFLSPDSADQFNRYQAFAANPIVNTDPTGQLSVPEFLTDGVAALLFLAFAVISFGAAAPAAASVFAAVVAGEEVAGAAIASAVFNGVSAAANLGAAATSGVLAADDAGAMEGQGFLDSTTRKNLQTANFALGTIAGITNVYGEAAGATLESTAADSGASTATEDLGVVDQAPGEDAAADPFNGVPPPADLPPPLPKTQSADSSILLTEPADYSSEEESLSAEESFSAEESPGQIAQPTDAGVQPLVASSPQPPPPDPSVAEFAQTATEAGQGPALNPEVSPLGEANQLPGSLAEVQPALQPTPTGPAPADNASLTTPLANEATTDLEGVMDGNTSQPGSGPPAVVNPLEENLPAPDFGLVPPGFPPGLHV